MPECNSWLATRESWQHYSLLSCSISHSSLPFATLTSTCPKKKKCKTLSTLPTTPLSNPKDGDSRGEAEGIERDSGRLGHGKVWGSHRKCCKHYSVARGIHSHRHEVQGSINQKKSMFEKVSQKFTKPSLFTSYTKCRACNRGRIKLLSSSHF